MAYDFCPVCREFANLNTHICPPVWEVLGPEDYGEDWYEIRARDEQQAAEKWAEQVDAAGAEYEIIQGEEPTVHVRAAGDPDAVVKSFVVRGETVPQYWATETKGNVV